MLPAVEQAAIGGRPERFALPRPMRGRPEPHFSFAGLKTAVRLHAEALVPLSSQDVADICAGFEQAAVASVVERTERAMAIAGKRATGPLHRNVLVVAGGVAANKRLRQGLLDLTQRQNWRLSVPPIALCTDNAAMVAWAGAERLALGLSDGLDVPVHARWPLDADATPVIGSGRLGAKA